MQRIMSGFGNKKRYYWDGDHLVCEITEDGTLLEWTCPKEEARQFMGKGAILLGITIVIYLAAMLQNCSCNRSIWTGAPSLFALISMIFTGTGLYRMRDSWGHKLSSWFYGMHDRIQIGALATTILLGISAVAAVVLMLVSGESDGIVAAVLYAVAAALSYTLRKKFLALTYDKVLE